MPHRLSSHHLGTINVAATLVSCTLVVAILYFAKVVLIPVALAVLLTFILSPLVTRLDYGGLGRIPAVLVVVGTVGLLLAAMFGFIGSQLHGLASDFPKYQENIRAKIEWLTQESQGGVIEKVQSTVEEATRQANGGSSTNTAAVDSAAEDVVEEEPVPVRLVPEQGIERALSAATASFPAVAPALEVLVTAGLVLVLAIFMLIKREDLRNRLVSLASYGSLTTTTKALDDAGQRISRYLMMQLVINATFGLAVGAGLWAIGVPYPLLWGLCAAVFRYIPYLGPWLAALLPISVSLITSPGWTQVVLVVVLFLVLELVSNNFMEPWLYGQGIGISAVALLISATFWTWIWGPVGLVLATPLTACLVVIGKHAPALQFLDRLLSDQPALPPHAALLQRLLARDTQEAAGIVEKYCAEHPPETVFDDVLIPALAMARRDRDRGVMTAADEKSLLVAMRAILDEQLGDGTIEPPDDADDQRESPESPLAAEKTIQIVGCAARHEAEELTLEMLRRLLAPRGVQFEVLSTSTLPSQLVDWVRRERPQGAVVAILPPGGLVQARFVCRQLRKRFPDLAIVVGCWRYSRGFDQVMGKLRAAGAQYVTTTLLGARDHILSLVAQPTTAAGKAARHAPAERAEKDDASRETSAVGGHAHES